MKKRAQFCVLLFSQFGQNGPNEVKQTLQQTAKTDFDGCVFEIMNQSPDELCADGLTKCLADQIQIGDRGTRH